MTMTEVFRYRNEESQSAIFSPSPDWKSQWLNTYDGDICVNYNAQLWWQCTYVTFVHKRLCTCMTNCVHDHIYDHVCSLLYTFVTMCTYVCDRYDHVCISVSPYTYVHGHLHTCPLHKSILRKWPYTLMAVCVLDHVRSWSCMLITMFVHIFTVMNIYFHDHVNSWPWTFLTMYVHGHEGQAHDQVGPWPCMFARGHQWVVKHYF